jgi:hypothetical protein
MSKPRLACIIAPKSYAPGSQPPDGYLDWHEWARVQHKAGLDQRPCPKCDKWRFPQESCCGLPPRGTG